MRTMTRTSPTPPVGAYPQLLLCDHVGSAPTSAKIKITINIVPIISNSFFPWLGIPSNALSQQVPVRAPEWARTKFKRELPLH